MSISASTKAAGIIRNSLLWENHCCMPFEAVGDHLPQLDRYRAAGFSVVHLNVGDSDIPLDRIIRSLAAFRRWLAERPDQYILVARVDDIHRAKAQGKLAVCFDIEGAQAMGHDIELISLFYEIGVRWLLMAYNRGNLVGAGCHDASDAGLTLFGRQFIAEMDRVGMIKDVAHTGYRTALEICRSSTVPVNISHSNPRALNDHPRCVPDDLMKACAETGGVLGITGLGIFLGGNDVSTANFIRSVDYAVEVMGIDHVGIGLDYSFQMGGAPAGPPPNPYLWPPGFGYDAGIRFVPPEQIGEIVEGLSNKGYREGDLAKILGGNFLRVAAQIWK